MMDARFMQQLIIVKMLKYFSKYPSILDPNGKYTVYIITEHIFSMFDNVWTVPYSCLVSIWAIIFLELWKRTQVWSQK